MRFLALLMFLCVRGTMVAYPPPQGKAGDNGKLPHLTPRTTVGEPGWNRRSGRSVKAILIADLNVPQAIYRVLNFVCK